MRTINDKKLLLGIDIGTSSIKFSITDASLKEYYYNSIKYEYDMLNKDWTEIDPNVWINIIITEVKSIFKLPFSKRISGICPTAQMHTLVFLDEKGSPVRKAILWNDRRTKNSIAKLERELDQDLELFYNANIISTGSPLANLLWLKKEEPENFSKIHKICMCKDYINFFFTGKVVTDYCDASTSCLMDLEKIAWSEKICDFFNFDIKILPTIQESTEMVGEMKKEIADELSITQNVKFFTGTGDNAATILAAKYFGESKLILSLGTSGVVLTENESLSLVGKNILLKYSNKEVIISQTSLSTGGKSCDWWFNNILNTSEYNDEQRFSENQIKKSEVLFLPYLSGEKYLYRNPYLSGAFYNLSLETDRHDLNLAILEGVTFTLKSLYMKSRDSIYKLNELILLGGGSKSDPWANIVANIFNTTVIRYKNSIEAVHGAAIIGLLGLKEEISITTSTDSRIYPKENLIPHYNNKYRYFCFLSDKMSDIAISFNEKSNSQ